MKCLDLIECHLGIILAVLGLVLTGLSFIYAIYTYKTNVREMDIRRLAKEVVAFYCVEQAAIKMLKEQMVDVSEQTIRCKLRDEAINLEGFRPTMSANGARKYL